MTLKLGPDGFDSIAIIGSAPSSVRLGPWHDPRWAIWGVSPGAYGQIPYKHPHTWFELHRWEPQIPGYANDPAAKPWFSPEYVRFLELFEGPVMVSHDPADMPTVKNAVQYPYVDILAKYGRYHMTSTMAWMIALAIEMRPKRIGLWGVDMAADEEYAYQRPGCQHFLGLAKSIGIEIVLPPESDLLQPTTMYGISELHPRHIKLMTRFKEMQAQHAQAVAMQRQGELNAQALAGAISNMKYILGHWVDQDEPIMEHMVSRASALFGRDDPITAARFEGMPQIDELKARLGRENPKPETVRTVENPLGFAVPHEPPVNPLTGTVAMIDPESLLARTDVQQAIEKTMREHRPKPNGKAE